MSELQCVTWIAREIFAPLSIFIAVIGFGFACYCWGRAHGVKYGK
jgi:hypothetical protein